MEKPRTRIHFRKDSNYDMGLLVWGRTVIPVWAITAVTALLVTVFLIGGGIEASVTNGQSFILLSSGGIIAALSIVTLIVWGLVTLGKNIAKDIKKATRIVHGEEKDWK